MKRLLPIAALVEMATALVLLAAPAFFVHLVLGANIAGAAVVLARLTGIALLAMGFNWWPGSWRSSVLIYNGLATLYFLAIAIRGEFVGPLLWPALVAHGVLAVLFVWTMGKHAGARSQR